MEQPDLSMAKYKLTRNIVIWIVAIHYCYIILVSCMSLLLFVIFVTWPNYVPPTELLQNHCTKVCCWHHTVNIVRNILGKHHGQSRLLLIEVYIVCQYIFDSLPDQEIRLLICEVNLFRCVIVIVMPWINLPVLGCMQLKCSNDSQFCSWKIFAKISGRDIS